MGNARARGVKIYRKGFACAAAGIVMLLSASAGGCVGDTTTDGKGDRIFFGPEIDKIFDRDISHIDFSEVDNLDQISDPEFSDGYEVGARAHTQHWPEGERLSLDATTMEAKAKLCQRAAEIRLQHFTSLNPNVFDDLRELTSWRGHFQLHHEDYSRADQEDLVIGTAGVQALNEDIVRITSISEKDGICQLPTRATIRRMYNRCRALHESDGSIQGCGAVNVDDALGAFDQARDVDLESFDVSDLPDVETYRYPEGTGDFGLGGTEHVIHSDSGVAREFGFEVGTANARKCMQASALRFEEIMRNPPVEILALLNGTNWGGYFFNYMDDYSARGTTGDAALWAWKTGLIKWNGSVDANGKCSLPTLDMVKRLGNKCVAYAESRDGEIERCQVR